MTILNVENIDKDKEKSVHIDKGGMGHPAISTKMKGKRSLWFEPTTHRLLDYPLTDWATR